MGTGAKSRGEIIRLFYTKTGVIDYTHTHTHTHICESCQVWNLQQIEKNEGRREKEEVMLKNYKLIVIIFWEFGS